MKEFIEGIKPYKARFGIGRDVKRGRLELFGHGLISIYSGLIEVLSLGYYSCGARAYYLFTFLDDD